MKWTNLELADEIISRLRLPEEIGMDDDGECDVADYIRQELHDLPVKVDWGATKLVIIPRKESDANWVLKIPFQGIYEYGYDYDEEENSNDKYLRTFCCGGGEYDDDYCAYELSMYEDAKEFGFEKYLAEVEFYCFDHGTKYYIQEKCLEAECSDSPKVSAESLLEASHINSYVCSEDWLAVAIEEYGLSEVERFIRYGEKIDLFDDTGAERNHGYSLSGLPKILDFAGFRD